MSSLVERLLCCSRIIFNLFIIGASFLSIFTIVETQDLDAYSAELGPINLTEQIYEQQLSNETINDTVELLLPQGFKISLTGNYYYKIYAPGNVDIILPLVIVKN